MIQSDCAVPPQRRRASTRRRLWELAGIMLIALSGVVVLEATMPADRAVTRGMLGQDFLAFYSAGTFVRTGQTDRLVRSSVGAGVRASRRRVAGLDIGDRSAPWWNPPFAAIPLAPLSAITFAHALDVWWIASVLALFASAVILGRFLPVDATADRLEAFKTRRVGGGADRLLMAVH